MNNIHLGVLIHSHSEKSSRLKKFSYSNFLIVSIEKREGSLDFNLISIEEGILEILISLLRMILAWDLEVCFSLRSQVRFFLVSI